MPHSLICFNDWMETETVVFNADSLSLFLNSFKVRYIRNDTIEDLIHRLFGHALWKIHF